MSKNYFIFFVCQLSMSSVHFCVWFNLFLTELQEFFICHEYETL